MMGGHGAGNPLKGGVAKAKGYTAIGTCLGAGHAGPRDHHGLSRHVGHRLAMAMAHGHSGIGQYKRGGGSGYNWCTETDAGMGYGGQGQFADLKRR